MAIVTTQYIRKPLYVDGVRVTRTNLDEIAAWCQGEVQLDEGTGKKYIHVRVHNPKNPRQTKAFVGDWLLYTERGYKVYTHKAFFASFDEVGPETDPPETAVGDIVMGSTEIMAGVTLNEAVAWLRDQPEPTVDYIRELVRTGEACSIQAEQDIQGGKAA